MRNLIFVLFISIILMACNDPFHNEQLPPATQTGANTFGFKLDGEVWLPYVEGFDFAGRRALTANYHSELQMFNIIARKFEDSKDVNEYFTISIDSLRQDIISDSVFIRGIRFWLSNGDFFSINSQFNDGKIEFSRIDTINNIISGTFEFNLNDGNKTIRITEGRFDFSYPFQRDR